eukprot:m51a1_g10097 hypothetical protein (1023) ;mRNA; f:66344-71469
MEQRPISTLSRFRIRPAYPEAGAGGPSLRLGVSLLTPGSEAPKTSVLAGFETYQTPDTPMWEGLTAHVALPAQQQQQQQTRGQDARRVAFVVLSSAAGAVPVSGVAAVADIRVGRNDVALRTAAEAGGRLMWYLSYEASAVAPPALLASQSHALALLAIELEPLGMGKVLDSVAGGLDASPARRLRVMRNLCNTALVNTLLGTPVSGASGWRGIEASMVLRTGGDKAKLRKELEALPYQRKLQLLDAQLGVTDAGVDSTSRDVAEIPNIPEKDKEQIFVQSQQPWVGVLSQMLQQAPDSLSNQQWLQLLIQVIKHYGAKLLHKIGDVLGRVVGRSVDTEEISDAEREGLAELVREVSNSGYSRVISELAQKAPSETSRVLIEASAEGGNVDKAATEYAKSGLETVGSRGILGLLSMGITLLPMVLKPLEPQFCLASSANNEEFFMRTVHRMSYRTVLHDSRVTGLLRDSQIDVVTRTTTKAEAGTAQWLPADGNLKDIDSVHAFATVRSVVDAVERVLRDIESIEKEEFMQELEALDEGRCSDVLAEKDKGLRWQVGTTLLVDTRANDVQPTYSRGAKGLLFPVRSSIDPNAPPVSTSRAFEAVAHTTGYAVLDALRPRWAEGIKETPEGAVLHEMFADLAGLLVGLGTAAVSGAVAAQTRGDMDAESITRRLQAGIADTLGLSGMRSACSTATAKDVWSPQTGKLQEGSKRWSSREVSAMITSSVWAAIASELARRCYKAADQQSVSVAAEDPAEVLIQLAQLALRALIVACLNPKFKDEAPKLVVFCDTLVQQYGSGVGNTDKAPSRGFASSKAVSAPSQDPEAAFGVALRRELQRRFLLSTTWSVQSQDQSDYLSLKKASIDHTSATKQLRGMAAAPRSNAANGVAGAGGPARRMCECIAVAAAQAARTVECPVSRQLWATLRTGAQQALDDTEDEEGAWEALVETWGTVERQAAGQVFVDRRMWSAIVVEAAEEATEEGIRASVRKLVLSLEYVTGCCKESPSLALWRRVLATYSNTN